MFILPNKIHKFLVSCFPKFISTNVTIFFMLKVLYYIWDINMKRITSIVLNMKDVNMIYIFLYLILNLNVNPKVHEAMIFDWILSMFWGLCNDLIFFFWLILIHEQHIPSLNRIISHSIIIDSKQFHYVIAINKRLNTRELFSYTQRRRAREKEMERAVKSEVPYIDKKERWQ